MYSNNLLFSSTYHKVVSSHFTNYLTTYLEHIVLQDINWI